MAPSVVETTEHVLGNVKAGLNDKTAPPSSETFQKQPLKAKGVLEQFDSFDVTPVIGREFTNANLKEWLRAPNSDELIRDLAITGDIYPFLSSCIDYKTHTNKGSLGSL